jgi:UDP-N-acetylmuramate: L-alanyl-gamma-D-glutamyl-meso-diaminopimelate ligase
VLVGRVAARSRSGDVILVMSNGAFGGFIPSLLAALEARGDRATRDVHQGES